MQRVLVALVVSLVLILSGCGGGTQSGSNSPALMAIQVTGPNANIIVGQTEQLKATGTFSAGSSQDLTNAVSWISSNPNSVDITAGGMLTAKASGPVVISAKKGTVTGSFNLTIAPALVSIAITPANSTIAPGTTVQLIATGTYTDNSTQNITSTVTWLSGTPSVATVSSTAPTMGLAHAVATGNTSLTATQGIVVGTTSLTVSSASETSFTIAPVNPALALGVSQQFTATAGFSDGSSQDVTGVTQWQSSATSVASITVSGLASAKNIGSTTITGSFGGMSANSTLTVNAANLNSISIKPADGTIAQGTKVQLAAIGSFNDGSTRDITHQVTWSSSNPPIVSVGSSNGIASGITPGLVTMTATLGSKTSSTSLNVSNATITSVLITPTAVTIPTGGSQRFTATGVFSDSTNQDISTVVAWSSSDTTVATVSNTSTNPGFAVGVTAGTANINASFSYAGATATGTDSLTVSSATLASLSLKPTTAEIAPASGLQFTATGTFTDGTTQGMNALLTWTSSDSTVAILNLTGFATGESAGITTITAKTGSVSATANLLVESATLTSVQVTPQTTKVAAGFQLLFKAIGTFSNGDQQDLTGFATWTSSSSGIATISNVQSTAGRATGVQPGTTTISAAFAGQVGTASLTVTNATLTSVSITPGSASIPVGGSQQFIASGSFSDGSSLTLNGQIPWTSSNPAVGTITSAGVASALSSGTSTISASLKGVTGTAILTVQ